MPSTSTREEATGSFDELKRCIQIDKNDLDSDLVEQPDLFWRVSEAYTLARSRQDEVKFEIAQLEGSLGAQFRDDAGDKKLTVDAVRQQIMSAPAMVTLQKDLLRAATNVGRWGALKEAYDMRASALKSLTQLFSSNYFTVQTGSRPRDEARSRLGDDVREAAGEERRNREPIARQRPKRDVNAD